MSAFKDVVLEYIIKAPNPRKEVLLSLARKTLLYQLKHCSYHCSYHIVWTTRYRGKVLADNYIKTELKRMFFAWETFAIHWIYLPLYIIIPLVIVAYITGRKWFQDDYPLVNLRSFFGMFIFLFVIVGIVLFYFHNPQPFIYFQF